MAKQFDIDLIPTFPEPLSQNQEGDSFDSAPPLFTSPPPTAPEPFTPTFKDPRRESMKEIFDISLKNLKFQKDKKDYDAFLSQQQRIDENIRKALDEGLSVNQSAVAGMTSFEDVMNLRDKSPNTFKRYVSDESYAEYVAGREVEVGVGERVADYMGDFALSISESVDTNRISYLRLKGALSGESSTEDLATLKRLKASREEKNFDIDRDASGAERDGILGFFLDMPMEVGRQFGNILGTVATASATSAIATATFKHPWAGVIGAGIGVFSHSTLLEAGLMLDELADNREMNGEEVNYDEMVKAVALPSAFNGMLEVLTVGVMGKVFGKFLPKSVTKPFRVKQSQNTMRNIMGTKSGQRRMAEIGGLYLVSMASEGGVESLQEMSNSVASLYDEEGDITGSAWIRAMGDPAVHERMKEAGLAGIQVSFLLGGMGSFATLQKEKTQTAQDKARLKALNADARSIATSQAGHDTLAKLNLFIDGNRDLLTGDPIQGRAMTEDTLKSAGIKEVFVDVKDVTALMDELAIIADPASAVTEQAEAIVEGVDGVETSEDTPSATTETFASTLSQKEAKSLLEALERIVGVSHDGTEYSSAQEKLAKLTELRETDVQVEAVQFMLDLAGDKNLYEATKTFTRLNKDDYSPASLESAKEYHSKIQEQMGKNNEEYGEYLRDVATLPDKLGPIFRGVQDETGNPLTEEQVEGHINLWSARIETMMRTEGLTADEAIASFPSLVASSGDNNDALNNAREVAVAELDLNNPRAVFQGGDANVYDEATGLITRSLTPSEQQWILSVFQNKDLVKELKDAVPSAVVGPDGTFEWHKDHKAGLSRFLNQHAPEVDEVLNPNFTLFQDLAEQFGTDHDTLLKEVMAIELEFDETGHHLAPNGSWSNLTTFQSRVTQTPAFKNWFGESKAVDENGEPFVVFHGSFSNIESFDNRKGQGSDKSNQSFGGNAFYFTTDPADASNNYADEGGPDVSSKLDHLTEEITQLVDDSENQQRHNFVKDEDGNLIPHPEKDSAQGLDGTGLQDDLRILFDSTNLEIDPQEIVEMWKRGAEDDNFKWYAELRKRIFASYENQGNVTPVFIKGENPFLLGHPDETYHSTSMKDTTNFQSNEAMKELEQVFFEVWENAQDNGWSLSSTQFSKHQEIVTAIYDADGLIQNDVLLQELKEAFAYAEDENGMDVSNEMARRVIQGLGYDSIVDHQPANRFWSSIGQGTDHWMMFNPTQAKSALSNVAFDPNDARIMFQTISTPVFTGAINRREIDPHTGLAKSNDDHYHNIHLPTILENDASVKLYARHLIDAPMLPVIPDEQPINTVQRYIDMGIENLKYLFRHIDPEIAKQSREWYVGANQLARSWAKKYNLSLQQTSGMIATLSPNNVWDKNVAQAEHIAEILTHHQDFAIDEKMHLKLKKLFTEYMKGQTASKASGTIGTKNYKPAVSKAEVQKAYKKLWFKHLRDMKGKTFADITTDEYGIWMRFADEILFKSNPDADGFRVYNPDGHFGDWARNAPTKAQEKRGELGNRSKYSSNSADLTKKAMIIFLNDDISIIADNLSKSHKVRSFYNNIFDPFSPRDDATMDVHATASIIVLPAGGSHDFIKKNFALAGGKPFGVDGLYAINQEIFRETARQLSIETGEDYYAREMQSILWEAQRGLFANKSDNTMAEIMAIWEQHTTGEITHEQALERIFKHSTVKGESSPITPPQWYTGPNTATDAIRWGSSYGETLFRTGLPDEGRANRPEQPLARRLDGSAVGTTGGRSQLDTVAKVARSEVPAKETNIESKSFKAWFGDSKMVNEDGTPQKFYHRTSADFDEFKAGGHDPELSGPAIWFSDSPTNQPQGHNRRTEGDRVIPVYLKIQNPLIITPKNKEAMREKYGVKGQNSESFPLLIDQSVVDRLKSEGYDGIDAKLEEYNPSSRFPSGDSEILIFDGGQAKGIHNETFSTTSNQFFLQDNDGTRGPAYPTAPQYGDGSKPNLTEQVEINLSVMQDTLPKIKLLHQLALSGNKQAQMQFQQVIEAYLTAHTAHIDGVTLDFTHGTGLYMGGVERSASITATFDPENRYRVNDALAYFAEVFQQEQIHLRSDEYVGEEGDTYADNSINTRYVRFHMTENLSLEDIKKVIDESGIVGLTTTPNMLEAYNVYDTQEDFHDQTQKVHDILKRLGTLKDVTSGIQRLWNYGDGGFTEYSEIRTGEANSEFLRSSPNRVKSSIGIIDPMFQSTVYHGAGTLDDVSQLEGGRFSNQFVGAQEGNIIYSWGLYFAQRVGVSEWYRNIHAGPPRLYMDGHKLEYDPDGEDSIDSDAVDDIVHESARMGHALSFDQAEALIELMRDTPQKGIRYAVDLVEGVRSEIEDVANTRQWRAEELSSALIKSEAHDGMIAVITDLQERLQNFIDTGEGLDAFQEIPLPDGAEITTAYESNLGPLSVMKLADFTHLTPVVPDLNGHTIGNQVLAVYSSSGTYILSDEFVEWIKDDSGGKNYARDIIDDLGNEIFSLQAKKELIDQVVERNQNRVDYIDTTIANLEAINEFLSREKELIMFERKDGGSVFRVELSPDETDYLYWDAVEENSLKVWDATVDLFNSLQQGVDRIDTSNPNYRQLADTIFKDNLSSSRGLSLKREYPRDSFSGADIYNVLVNEVFHVLSVNVSEARNASEFLHPTGVEGIPFTMSDVDASPRVMLGDREGGSSQQPFIIMKFVAEELNKRGVAGMKFWDGASRFKDADQTHTYNYVVWDDSTIGAPVKFLQDGDGTHTTTGSDANGGRHNGYFDATQNLIGSSPTANSSTFVHEMTHAHMDVLIKRAMNKTTADENSASDLKEVLQWLGSLEGGNKLTVQDLIITGFESSAELALKKARHEAFADGAILYMAEGKSPSAGLARVFKQFRDWLVAYVEAIQKRGVILDDSIREIYSGMLFNDGEMLSAQDVIGAHPISAQKLNMNPDEHAKYVAEIENAILTGTKLLDQSVIRKANRKKSKAYTERKKVVKAQVEDELDKVGRYRFIEQFRGTKKPRKLAKELVVSTLKGHSRSAELRKKMQSMYTIGKTGEPIEAVAGEFGYSSAVEMIVDLVDGPKYQDEVKRITEERMVAENKVNEAIALPLDETTDEAQEALHNSSWTNALLAEISALERATKRKMRVPADMLKANARAMIDTLRIKNIKPAGYIQQERLASRRALALMEKGDLEGALAEKAKQVMNQYLYREATTRLKKIDKLHGTATRMNTKNGLKGVDETYLPHIRGILARFDLRKSAKVNGEAVEDDSSATISFIQNLVEENNLVRIDPENPILKVDKLAWHQLTAKDFEALVNGLKHLKKLGTEEQTVFLAGQRYDLGSTLDNLINGIIENMNPKGSSKTLVAPKHGLFRTYIAQLRKRTNQAKTMDGQKEDGPAQNILIDPMNWGMSQEEQRNIKEYELISALNKKYGIDHKYLSKQFKVETSTGTLDLARETILSMAMNYGNKENRQRLLETVGRLRNQSEESAQNIIDKAFANLTEADWNFVQETWNYLDSFWPEVADLEFRTTGIRPERVERQKFEAPTGQMLEGGYYPIYYSSELGHRTRVNETAEVAKDVARGISSSSMTKHGHAIKRVGSGGQSLNLTIGVMTSHVQSVVHDLTMRETLMSLGKILKNTELRETITNHFGAPEVHEWETWLNRSAVGDAPARKSTDKIASRYRSRVTIMAMGFNASTALLQLAGINQTVAVIGWKATTIGVTEYMANRVRPIEWRNEINDLSPFMASRSSTMNRDIRETLNDIKKSKKQRGYEGLLFKPIAFVQGIVDSITWAGAYNKGLEDGETDGDAVRRADRAVELSQGSGRISHQSTIEGGTGLEKTFTTFFSFMNTMWNLVIDKHQENVLSDRNFAHKVAMEAYNFMFLYIFPATITSWLQEVVLAGNDELDEKEELFGTPEGRMWLFQNNANFMVAQFPMLRELWPTGYRYEGPAGIRWAGDVQGGVNSLIALLMGDEDHEGFDGENIFDDPVAFMGSSDARAILEAVGVLGPIPIPTVATSRFVKGVRRIQEGETEGLIDAGSGLIFRKVNK